MATLVTASWAPLEGTDDSLKHGGMHVKQCYSGCGFSTGLGNFGARGHCILGGPNDGDGDDDND